MGDLGALLDGHGGPIASLRVSVTDRWNFRCRYCIPADGLGWRRWLDADHAWKPDGVLSGSEIRVQLHANDPGATMRSAVGDTELEQVFGEAIWRKELKHHISEPGIRQPARTMGAIGGERAAVSR